VIADETAWQCGGDDDEEDDGERGTMMSNLRGGIHSVVFTPRFADSPLLKRDLLFRRGVRGEVNSVRTATYRRRASE
jgi:hypothetical protein